ncbi:MAG: class E sortase, partial [Actinomycetota bacterium]
LLSPAGDSSASRRTRRVVGSTLLTIAAALLLGGAGVGFYPFYTDLRAGQQQKTLQEAFDRSSKEEFSRLKKAYFSNGRVKVEEGKPLTWIRIPKLNVNAVVVEGITLPALTAGAGHYPDSPLPGEPGNVSIAGHRTMHGKPFADLDQLGPGDKIILITPVARHTYEVVPAFGGHANPWVIAPHDWSVIEVATDESLLTMTTCHPKGSARQRLAARARLAKSEPIS